MPDLRLNVILFYSGDAEDLGNALKLALESQCHVEPWKVQLGDNIGSAIIKKIESSDFCVLLLTPGGQASTGQLIPRNNVVFEIGLATGILGADRTLLVMPNDQIQTPVHTLGIAAARLGAGKSSGEIVGPAATALLDAMQAKGAKGEGLPRLFGTVSRMMADLRSENPTIAKSIDETASDLLSSLAGSFQGGINDFFVSGIRANVKSASAIFGLDTIGPSQWIRPQAFAYLAIQIREYVSKNVTHDGWKLTVDDNLKTWIDKACQNARRALGESHTDFDNADRFEVITGTPNLQIARVLLWSRDELLSSIGASIIEVHDSFHIPLFFIDTARKDKSREFEFVLFENQNNDPKGFSSRAPKFEPEEMSKGCIRGQGGVRAHDVFLTHMDHRDLLFAKDARLAFDGT